MEEAVRPFFFLAVLERGRTHAQFPALANDLAKARRKVIFALGVQSPVFTRIFLAIIREPIFDFVIATGTQFSKS
jgi:hypothetical protein